MAVATPFILDKNYRTSLPQGSFPESVYREFPLNERNPSLYEERDPKIYLDELLERLEDQFMRLEEQQRKRETIV